MSTRGRADRIDRGEIALEVPYGVLLGACRFPEHVVGEPIATRLERLGPLERFVDRASQHELVAEDADRMPHGLADHGLARTGD